MASCSVLSSLPEGYTFVQGCFNRNFHNISQDLKFLKGRFRSTVVGRLFIKLSAQRHEIWYTSRVSEAILPGPRWRYGAQDAPVLCQLSCEGTPVVPDVGPHTAYTSNKNLNNEIDDYISDHYISDDYNIRLYIRLHVCTGPTLSALCFADARSAQFPLHSPRHEPRTATPRALRTRRRGKSPWAVGLPTSLTSFVRLCAS